MLAKNVNDNTGGLNARAYLAFFASRLAPTGFCQFATKPSLPKLYPHLTAADLDLRNLLTSGLTGIETGESPCARP
ncbi:hypothetical protein C1Y18_02295 [Pseudomonas sp. MPR-R5A]|nr:hypothetical protein C1Y25_00750 [Pseudomonas sp. MPBC4-3]PMX28069.1 hypothetical protein C1Y23_06285 [Pseudomonas sp. GW460-12]PMX36380.1 hypothetical protein C1Y24_06240 [Pseudomonas sp. MPR-R2A4]PMX42621.1 hypothetical protein C1Y26_05750 [Pseudomonas sp. MPR-R2A7]PMX50126.1 hypothetical protein C1Y20_04465 [Pseudomonas sp. FW301-21B01]PMX54591.1 hypothetical protein C1Y17_07270 [Pseudomonas sp. MPR-R2A6]PMX92016.1 hypothetical protein C1Y21_08405 [Pseudomonas sp. MPR-R2A3]PMY10842.1 h